jgi:beta-1,4-mannosyl-glycoprotein beta-1,4-N-acetylglucosaminyltransferase
MKLLDRSLSYLSAKAASFFSRPRLDDIDGQIYDIFTFFNELELLEIRLNILAPHVDYFVIIECEETFSGKPKELFFENNKERFAKWKDKIIHYVIRDVPKNPQELRNRLSDPNLSDLDREIIASSLTSDNIPPGATHWFKEFYQKESIKKAIIGLNDNDLCFVSDVDEIWNPNAVIDFRKPDAVFRLRQRMYAYYLNNRSSERWAGTLVTRYKIIRTNCLNHLRTPRKTKYLYVGNGGWHFTNMGGADRIRLKLESYGHQEFNNDKVKSKIEERIAANRDFVGRGFHFWADETHLPEYVTNNRHKYRHWFK